MHKSRTSKPERSRLAREIIAFWPALLNAGLFSAVINLLWLMPSIYMLQVYDRVITSRNVMTLIMLSLILATLMIAMNVIDWIRSQIAIRFSNQLDLRLHRDIFEGAFGQSLKTHTTAPVQALTDLATVRQFLAGNALFALFDAPWLPIYLIVLFIFDVSLGLFALGAVIALTLIAWLNERFIRSALKEANQGASDLLMQVTEQFKNAEAIRAMGMLPRLIMRWQGLHLANIHLQSEASKVAAIFGSVSRFSRLFLQSAILGLGAMLVIEDKISAGMMIAGSILMGRALSPLEQIITASRQYSLAREAAMRLNALLKDPVTCSERMTLPVPQGRLTVENLQISLPGMQQPILTNITFQLSPGDVVAVIGPSGSGKSSLARALVGALKPDSGIIRIDGADMNDWSPDDLGQHFGYLPQGVELFDGTVAQNISRFEEINSGKILQASLASGMHALILKLPQGYNTVIGTKAYRLSGGMQQRLGLARAIYGNPAFVVLDEPNSNLDQAGEEHLLSCIQSLKKQRITSVIVTHRTNILQVATHVLILAEGQIISFGPANTLLDTRTTKISDKASATSQ